MTNGSYTMNRGERDRRTSCIRALGISCLVVAVVGIALGLWGIALVSRNPAYRQAFVGAREMVQCEMNLGSRGTTQNVASALDRYVRRHGQYPATIADLHPDFLEDRSVLHCPADPGPEDEISYEYIRPAMDAPDDTIIVTCDRHVIFRGRPPVKVYLRKDGKAVRESPQFTRVESAE